MHGIPNQQACLVQSQSGARLAWNIMPVYLPNGTQEILIFKSSSGEERQICECLEWRGGRVDHPDQLRDGSNVVAAASPAPPGPVPMVPMVLQQEVPTLSVQDPILKLVDPTP